jgi:hypothetical protein
MWSPALKQRLLALAFWGASAFAFVMAVLPHPPPIPGDPPDKVQHMAAFAVMTALASLAWPTLRRHRILLTLSAFGAFIELVQAIPALHRDCDWRDWVADTLAILVTLVAVSLWRYTARRSHRRAGVG